MTDPTTVDLTVRFTYEGPHDVTAVQVVCQACGKTYDVLPHETGERSTFSLTFPVQWPDRLRSVLMNHAGEHSR